MLDVKRVRRLSYRHEILWFSLTRYTANASFRKSPPNNHSDIIYFFYINFLIVPSFSLFSRSLKLPNKFLPFFIRVPIILYWEGVSCCTTFMESWTIAVFLCFSIVISKSFLVRTRISHHLSPSSTPKAEVGSSNICNSMVPKHVFNVCLASTIDIPHSLRPQVSTILSPIRNSFRFGCHSIYAHLRNHVEWLNSFFSFYGDAMVLRFLHFASRMDILRIFRFRIRLRSLWITILQAIDNRWVHFRHW